MDGRINEDAISAHLGIRISHEFSCPTVTRVQTHNVFVNVCNTWRPIIGCMNSRKHGSRCLYWAKEDHTHAIHTKRSICNRPPVLIVINPGNKTFFSSPHASYPPQVSAVCSSRTALLFLALLPPTSFTPLCNFIHHISPVQSPTHALHPSQWPNPTLLISAPLLPPSQSHSTSASVW